MKSLERRQTNKHTNKKTYKKHTYRVKTEETFFYLKVLFFQFSFKKAVSNNNDHESERLFEQNRNINFTCVVGIAAGGITRDASMTSRWTLDGQLLSIACPSVTSRAQLPFRVLSNPLGVPA